MCRACSEQVLQLCTCAERSFSSPGCFAHALQPLACLDCCCSDCRTSMWTGRTWISAYSSASLI